MAKLDLPNILPLLRRIELEQDLSALVVFNKEDALAVTAKAVKRLDRGLDACDI